MGVWAHPRRCMEELGVICLGRARPLSWGRMCGLAAKRAAWGGGLGFLIQHAVRLCAWEKVVGVQGRGGSAARQVGRWALMGGVLAANTRKEGRDRMFEGCGTKPHREDNAGVNFALHARTGDGERGVRAMPILRRAALRP